MKPFIKAIGNHLHFWGENYIQIPVITGLLFASIGLFEFLTGRSPIEAPGAIVGWIIQALGCCVVASLTGMTQRFLFGYTSKLKTPPPFKFLCLDSAITCFLLALWSVLIFGLIR